MSRVGERAAREAEEMLGDLRGDLTLESADVEVLKAISRGENVARAEQALSALRLRMEFSMTKPAVTVQHTAIAVIDPYAEPPGLPPTTAPALPAAVDAEVVEIEKE